MEYSNLVQFCNHNNIQFNTQQIDFVHAFMFTFNDVEYVFGKFMDEKWYQCTNQDNEKIKESIWKCINWTRENQDVDDTNYIQNQEAFAAGNY